MGEKAGLGSEKLPPFSKRGVALGFEGLAVVDVAVEIEMVIERSVGRDEFLQVRHSPEPGHRSLSSPERQVAILRPIIKMATDLLAVDISNVFHRGAIRPEPIRHDGSRCAVALHGFSQEPQCR